MRMFGNRPSTELSSVTLEGIAQGIGRIETKTEALAASVQSVQRAVDVLTEKQSTSEGELKRAFDSISKLEKVASDSINALDIKASAAGAEMAVRFEKRAVELAAVSTAQGEDIDDLKSKSYWVMGVGAGFGVLGAVVVALLQYIAFDTVNGIKDNISKIETEITSKSTASETDRRDLRDRLRDLERAHEISAAKGKAR